MLAHGDDEFSKSTVQIYRLSVSRFQVIYLPRFRDNFSKGFFPEYTKFILYYDRSLVFYGIMQSEYCQVLGYVAAREKKC